MTLERCTKYLLPRTSLDPTRTLVTDTGQVASPRSCQTGVHAVPRCRSVSAGLLAVQATPLRGGLRPAWTAPTPRGVRQLARNSPKAGHQAEPPLNLQIRASPVFELYSPAIVPDTEGGTMAQRLILIDDL